MFHVWLPHSPSFYQGQMAGLEGIDCAAVKHDCETRYPDDGGGFKSPANQGFDACLSMGGYYESANGCFESRTWTRPGATTYPIDVVTNPDNPDYVFHWPAFLEDAAASFGVTPWVLIAGGAAVLLAFGSFFGRRR